MNYPLVAPDNSPWAGYAVTGPTGSVTKVSGSWVQPTITCSPSTSSHSSFWVGIDGYNYHQTSNTVEQAGVAGYCTRAGTPACEAWYQFVPSAGVDITNITPSAGDIVSVTVSYNAATAMFTVNLTDGSARFSISHSNSMAKENSAECIAEDTVLGSGNFADFGVADFGSTYTTSVGCSAKINGTSESFGDFSTTTAVEVVDSSGNVLATVSPLDPLGSSFSVTWQRAT
ncbi:MAG TPA: G1 family glutamic endopeptidase [Thermoplasmata archaeon]|nr:G1 family glutamic endopeptidase [Thermoplasmata archaeon]